MGIPIIFLGQCLVDTIIKVLVVGEDNMSTNVVELGADLLAPGKAKGTGVGFEKRGCSQILLE